MNEHISIQATLLDFLQQHLRQIRGICNWSGSEMAQVLGVTRQTVSNIETGKTKLPPSLYLAIGAMLEKRCQQSPLLKEYLDVYFSRFPSSLFNIDDRSVAADTLVESWFATFPEQFSKTVSAYEPSSILMCRQLMQSISQNCKILLCPSIVLHDRQLDCIEELCEMAHQHGNSPILPYRAFREMEKQLSHDSAQRIQKLLDTKLLAVYGSEDDPPLNLLTVQLFFSLRMKYRLAFITDDSKLADDLRQLNSLKTVDGYPAYALTITDDGLLQNYFPADGMTLDNSVQDGSENLEHKNLTPIWQREDWPPEMKDFSGVKRLTSGSPLEPSSTSSRETKEERNTNSQQASAFDDWITL